MGMYIFLLGRGFVSVPLLKISSRRSSRPMKSFLMNASLRYSNVFPVAKREVLVVVFPSAGLCF
uniref:Ein3-binding f-box protein 3 n=1 Tax=Solanum tuberosum TaxID=4113 RepID=M1AB50_SOLTU